LKSWFGCNCGPKSEEKLRMDIDGEKYKLYIEKAAEPTDVTF